MSQIEVRLQQGADTYFSIDTCQELISAMANVPGDTGTVLAFFNTVTRLYSVVKPDLKPSLLRSLLRMTIKAPILFEMVFDFVKDIPEAVEVLSKKFQIPETGFLCTDGLLIQANQYFVFGQFNAFPADRIDLPALENRFRRAYLKDFACSWILFSLKVSDNQTQFDG